MPQPSFGLFALFTVFDLISVFAVFVISLQLSGIEIKVSMYDDVMKYSFQTSLFDCVLNAAFRMFELLFAHLVYRSTSVLPVTLSTVITTAFTIVKVFMYRYSYDEGNAVFAYILIFFNLLIAWVELWLFFVTVRNPYKASQVNPQGEGSFIVVSTDDINAGGGSQYRRYGAVSSDRTGRGMLSVPGGAAPSERYFSAAGSEDDGDSIYNKHYKVKRVNRMDDLSDSDELSPNDTALLVCKEMCVRLTDELFRLAFNDEVPWKQMSGFNDCLFAGSGTASVVAAEFRINAPIFRVVIDLKAPLETVQQAVINDIVNLPNWHPFVPESKQIERLVDETANVIEVIYQTSQPALGGFVSARDFVTLRHIGQKDGVIYSVSIGTAHEKSPPRDGYVRGENGPCCYMLIPDASPYYTKLGTASLATSSPTTRFIWIVNSDVKGGLPSTIVSRAMNYAIRRFISDLQTHLANVAPSPSMPTSPLIPHRPLTTKDNAPLIANDNATT